MFQQVFTSNFKLGLLCVLFMVVESDVLKTFLSLKLSTQGILKHV